MKLARIACETLLPASAILGLLLSRKNKSQNKPRQDPSIEERIRLRQLHKVRLAEGMEEGMPIRNLPAGVYGFTFAPSAEGFGLFAKDNSFAFEVHKPGEVQLLAYTTKQDAIRLASAGEFVLCELYPVPYGEATRLVAVPLSRIAKRRPPDRRRANCLYVDVMPVAPRVHRFAQQHRAFSGV